ncbi:MAG: hypothetical protein ACREBO_10650 [Novosphingobium sp.]
MGREASALVTFRGDSAKAKLLLEGSELILRGGHKARLPRDTIAGIVAGPDGLRLTASGEPLHAALPEAEAARWAKALATAPPSLAGKLGIGPDKRALVLGAIDEPALAEALAGATMTDPGSAAVVLAMILDADHLERARHAAANAGLALWCVYPKGKAAAFGDAAIRDAMRAAGWIDTKVSAVSERLTATRYAPKRQG